MREIWTEKEVDILKKMLDAGCSLREMADILKSRTEAGIRAQLRSQGWHVVNTREIDYDAFKKLMKQKGRVIECG